MSPVDENDPAFKLSRRTRERAAELGERRTSEEVVHQVSRVRTRKIRNSLRVTSTLRFLRNRPSRPSTSNTPSPRARAVQRRLAFSKAGRHSRRLRRSARRARCTCASRVKRPERVGDADQSKELAGFVKISKLELPKERALKLREMGRLKSRPRVDEAQVTEYLEWIAEAAGIRAR